MRFSKRQLWVNKATETVTKAPKSRYGSVWNSYWYIELVKKLKKSKKWVSCGRKLGLLLQGENWWEKRNWKKRKKENQKIGGTSRNTGPV